MSERKRGRPTRKDGERSSKSVRYNLSPTEWERIERFVDRDESVHMAARRILLEAIERLEGLYEE